MRNSRSLRKSNDNDAAFEFDAKGDDLGKWHVAGSGASIDEDVDFDRRADVLVLDVMPMAQHLFMLGDTASDANRGDDPWDSTKRAVSFWYKREFLNCRVLLTSSLGERYIDYKFTTGTHSVDGSGNVTFYLGSMPTTEWTRFERNVEEDFEAVSSGTWTNMDGLYIRIPGTLGSEDTLLDDIRLSNSLTVEHNTLGPGVIGHILRNTTWDDTSSLAREDKWFHYDQVGSVMSVSDGDGDLAVTHQQDAFGNVMASWSGGQWELAQGRHLNTKETDSSSHLVYMLRRWYSPELGRFASNAPKTPFREHQYTFAASYPTYLVDVTGEIDMNIEEVEFALSLSMYNASVYRSCTNEAIANSEQAYEHETQVRKKSATAAAAIGNALRHGSWQCCLSKQLAGQWIGLFGYLSGDATPAQLATWAGNAHESREPAGSADSKVDQLNNAIGRGMGCPSSDCWKQANRLYDSGKLWYDNGGTPTQGFVPRDLK